MKLKKIKKLSINVAIILTSAAIVFGAMKFPNTTDKSAAYAFTAKQEPEALNGIADFYIKPAGDSRIWHIINKYPGLNQTGGNSSNMSYYTFTSDSVLVVNEYAEMPKAETWDAVLARFFMNQENINN